MAETVDLLDLLKKPLSEFPDRPDLPGGKTFFAKLVGLSAGHSRAKETPYFQFDAKITDPGDDVPKDALAKIAAAGFNLGDYAINYKFYVTPNSMVMLKRFLVSLGFSEGTSSFEILQLDPETGNPTAASQDVVRGLDVLVKTSLPNDRGRVYMDMDLMTGTKRG